MTASTMSVLCPSCNKLFASSNLARHRRVCGAEQDNTQKQPCPRLCGKELNLDRSDNADRHFKSRYCQEKARNTVNELIVNHSNEALAAAQPTREWQAGNSQTGHTKTGLTIIPSHPGTVPRNWNTHPSPPAVLDWSYISESPQPQSLSLFIRPQTYYYRAFAAPQDFNSEVMTPQVYKGVAGDGTTSSGSALRNRIR
jgi:endogenous inhibitor of DNA gyrase (YacG/DUF329 family)